MNNWSFSEVLYRFVHSSALSGKGLTNCVIPVRLDVNEIGDPFPSFKTLRKMKYRFVILLLPLGAFTFCKDLTFAEQGRWHGVVYCLFRWRFSHCITRRTHEYFPRFLTSQFCQKPTNSNLTIAVACSMRLEKLIFKSIGIHVCWRSNRAKG